MEGYISEIRLFGPNWAPRSWVLCIGQSLSISQYSALYSLIGTTYGGDGRTHFTVPDLRSRCPIGYGMGPGLSNFPIGAAGGAEQVTLTAQNLPVHSHAVNCVDANGNVPSPENALPGGVPLAAADIWSTESHNAQMSATMLTSSGFGQPFPIRQPYQGLSYIMCVAGFYPSRE